MTAQPRKSLADRVKENENKKDDSAPATNSTDKKEDEKSSSVTKKNDDTERTNESINSQKHHRITDEDIKSNPDKDFRDNLLTSDASGNISGDAPRVTETGQSRDTTSANPSETPVNINLAELTEEEKEKKPHRATSEAALARAAKLAPTGPGNNMYSGGTAESIEAPEGADITNTPSEIALTKKSTASKFDFAEPLPLNELDRARLGEDDRNNKDDEDK